MSDNKHDRNQRWVLVGDDNYKALAVAEYDDSWGIYRIVLDTNNTDEDALGTVARGVGAVDDFGDAP